MPGKPRPKNTAADREFITQHAQEFRVVDGLLVWSHRKEDIGSPWQLPPDDQRCTRERTLKDDDGEPILDPDLNPLKARCPKWVIRNSHICIEHAGGSATVQAMVREKLIAASDAVAGRLIDLALNADDSDAIKAINSVLDRIGIRPGIEISAEQPLWQRILKAELEAEEQREADA